MKAEVIRARSIHKAYHNATVIEDLNFVIFKGEFHTIIGLSDSGKSTIKRILLGEMQLDKGCLYIDGYRIRNHSKVVARTEGIFAIDSKSALVSEFSVSDNLVDFNRKISSIYKKKENVTKAKKVLSKYGMDINPNDKVKNQILSTRHLLEIIKAAEQSMKLLILDDIMATYNQEEIDRIMLMIEKLKSLGISVLLLTQQIRPSIQFSNQIHILKHGSIVKTFYKGKYSQELLRKAFITHKTALITEHDEQQYRGSTFIFQFENNKGHSKKIFNVFKGEIVGILEENTQTINNLCSLILGEEKSKSVNMILNGSIFQPKGIYDAFKQGIGYIPVYSDEKIFFEDMSIQYNLFFQVFEKLSGRFGILTKRRLQFARSLLTTLDYEDIDSLENKVKTCSLRMKYELVYKKWRLVSPKMLVCVRPFETIDEVSKTIVKEELQKIAEWGTSILILTSDHEAIKSICNRLIPYADDINSLK